MNPAEPAGPTVTELRQALAQRQFVLHYQLIFELHGNSVIGAEALLRWQHPTRGLLPPGRFLPLAKSSGLIQDLGAWVLDAACHQMAAWQALGWEPFRLAVKVSAHQVGPHFDARVKGVLADTGLAAEHLEIQLTESVAFGDPVIFPALEVLRQLGVRFVADDFGTGYSCLQHLKCCPIRRTFLRAGVLSTLPGACPHRC